MSQFYDDMAATVVELVAEFGVAMTLARPKGSADPVEGELSSGEDALAVTGVMMTRTSRLVRESLAEGADRMAVLGPSVQPAMNDRLVTLTDTWALVQIDEINPAGTPLAYVVHLRR